MKCLYFMQKQSKESNMQVRETYYELYFDGDLRHEGTYEECRNLALQAYDDDCAEVYEVTVTEDKVTL